MNEVLNQRIQFENCVCSCNYDAMYFIHEYIENFIANYSNSWIENFIQKLVLIRPFNYKFLADVLEIALKGSKLDIKKINSIISFHYYLYLRNPEFFSSPSIFNRPLYKTIFPQTIDEYENPFGNETLAFYIKNDSVSDFINKVTLDNININTEQIKIINPIFFQIGLISEYSIMDFACFCGSLNIIKYLIVNGVHIHEKSVELSVIGGSQEVVEYLVTNGAEINVKCINNCTPLMLATYQNYPKIVEYLLEHGADPQPLDDFENSALTYAKTIELQNLIKKYLNQKIEK